MSKIKLFLILMLLVFSTNSYAYLDPGTMTYVFQALVAIFVGGFIAIKTSWVTIKSFLSNLFRKDSSS